MLKKLLLLGGWLTLFSGCEKQARLNSEKIDALTQRIAQQDELQANQIKVMQAQLAQLAPQLDRETSAYFEKNHDAALFFHTNTLYLLLTIGKQIESQLQAADEAHTAQNSLLQSYYTNQLNTTLLTAIHLEDLMTNQESRVTENINAETRRVSLAVSNALAEQIKITAMPDTDEIGRRQKLEKNLAQMQQDLNAIKAKLETMSQPVMPTNPPTVP